MIQALNIASIVTNKKNLEVIQVFLQVIKTMNKGCSSKRRMPSAGGCLVQF